MMLSDFENVVPIKVLKDASFDTLGLLSDPQPGMLVFIEDIKFQGLLRKIPDVACVITTEDLGKKLDFDLGIAVCENPRRSFFDLHNHFVRSGYYWDDFPTEIDKTAVVHPGAYVSEKNIRIGPGAIIEPNVTIMERCIIGLGVKVRAGVVLGSAGFQSSRFEDGMVDMLHAGGIRVDDGAEILSNAVVARAVFRQFTTVGQDSRVGNLSFISHNVQIGPRCFIGHGSVINGNVRLGAEVWIGPGTTLSNSITVGDNAYVSIGSTVVGDVPSGKKVTGYFAIEHKNFLKFIKSIKQAR